MDEDGAVTFLRDLAALNIVVDNSVEVPELAILRRTAERLQLSAYDAAYLSLALREGLPLATSDAALQRACHSEGIALL